MNKLGWFFDGLFIGQLIVLTIYGIQYSFNNDFIIIYVLSLLFLFLSPWLYKEKQEKRK